MMRHNETERWLEKQREEQGKVTELGVALFVLVDEVKSHKQRLVRGSIQTDFDFNCAARYLHYALCSI